MLLEGWLGSSAPRGEPERLTISFGPGRSCLASLLRRPRRAGSAPLADPAAIEAAAPANAPRRPMPRPMPQADAATSPPEPAHKAAAPALPAACVRFAGLSGDQASDMIERARRASKALTIDDARAGTPNGWWVYVPPQGSRDAADGKVAELRALGVRTCISSRTPVRTSMPFRLGSSRPRPRRDKCSAACRRKGSQRARVAAQQ